MTSREARITKLKLLFQKAEAAILAVERGFYETELLIGTDVMALSSSITTARIMLHHYTKHLGDIDVMNPTIRFRDETKVDSP